MLRKISHIIISLLLLTVTAGFSISKHYCGSRLVSVSIDHEAKSCCDMEGTSSCCHNETKVFQLEENFLISSVLDKVSIQYFDIFFIDNIQIDFSIDTAEQTVVFIPESPPPKKQQTVLSSLQSYLC